MSPDQPTIDPPLPEATALPSAPPALASALLAELRGRANADNVEGMARYGISGAGTLGVTMPVVRGLARIAKQAVGRRDRDALHELALELWASGVHEARIMATVLDVPALCSRDQAEAWVLDLESWDTCDQLCGNLLWRTSYAWDLPFEWVQRPETFVKRAGFVMGVQLAGKDKTASDEQVLSLLALVEQYGFDERNDVKKGANWLLRQVGKVRPTLNAPAIETAEHLLAASDARDAGAGTRTSTPDIAAARWIARDALRELHSDAVRRRLGLE